VSASQPGRATPDTDARRDIALIIVGTGIFGALAVHFEWSEQLFAWTRRSESFQLDEFTFVLIALAIGMAWFSARRWRAAQRELNARLAVQARLALTLDEQRRLSRESVDQQERERKRLSQELHDELGQFINAIKIDAVSIRDSQPAAGDPFGRAQSIIANVDLVHESVARLIRELRPVGLDELGLSAAIEHCADLWRGRLSSTQISLTLDERIDGLDETLTLVLYRIVQEGLTNCARHARATRIDIRIAWGDGHGSEPSEALVHIEDDGVGAKLDAEHAGLGLIGMRERVTTLGGSLSIESTPRQGFGLVARIPVCRTVEARA
jgi:signal transduction histidine kinase